MHRRAGEDMMLCEIDQMPAGSEMDALVAETVMGWIRHPKWQGQWIALEQNPDTYCPTPFQLDWFPSEDISAAWEVVMRAPILAIFRVSKFDGSIAWQAQSKRCNYPGSMHVIENDCCIFGEANTAPLAISRAALKAKAV